MPVLPFSRAWTSRSHRLDPSAFWEGTPVTAILRDALEDEKSVELALDAPSSGSVVSRSHPPDTRLPGIGFYWVAAVAGVTEGVSLPSKTWIIRTSDSAMSSPATPFMGSRSPVAMFTHCGSST